jgi:serine/threonine protein kinase
MILTELLKDSLLEAYQNKPEYFTLPRLQAITRQIATALATLHRLHIIHCDLKP